MNEKITNYVVEILNVLVKNKVQKKDFETNYKKRIRKLRSDSGGYTKRIFSKISRKSRKELKTK